jgi:hypothetical protein
MSHKRQRRSIIVGYSAVPCGANGAARLCSHLPPPSLKKELSSLEENTVVLAPSYVQIFFI